MSDAPPEADAPPSRPRRSDRSGQGRRTRLRRRRRRRALARVGLGLATVVSVALAVVWVATTFEFGGDEAAPLDEPTTAQVSGDDPQLAYVLATFDDTRTNPPAELVTVVAAEPATGEATVLLVPSTVVADVPGHGLLPLGDAYAFDEGPLLDLSIGNLLGIDLDGAVGISEQGWSALFSRIGPLTIEVPEDLTALGADGTRTIRFRKGDQVLDGPRLAEYLTFAEEGETELQRLPRVAQVFAALLDAIVEDPEALERVFEDGAPMLDTTEPDRVRELLAVAAGARAADGLETRTLPVDPLGAGRDGAYRLDEERAEALVAERFAASRPDGVAEDGRRLQILNGNGVPGIGQQVAERLQPAGFRVVLTRNADRFDHPTTRIIVHEDTDDRIAAAQRIQDLLGVGEIELSEVPLDVADITVIVGQDFPS